ncbi:2-succinyl-5-enolpyruvyl-6-hydroxy-3-cyclohexene-1-carboxylic-acid synthase [Hungatella hathewayi]|uniref:2-succinyl-5-enolpyruvyl-6-hydroxy-3- cyclohexene-1-carboxylic-acid synthase n=1 Tax=Hungatella hathewayi TaxID=154046 RepID=UPI00210AC19C|nr:2-succinyl-5-enolpyruvyl-6-hydroxy-3-cyclohexene-1-carboxylic-acid synthase [Hungatella hathewayi]MCQ5386532.1 2-succinyl-5-enolpyruvyl-6-hydroxy-3-cyclohexene-1-carboxylic-acid synthase [Hungatella hathewayi]
MYTSIKNIQIIIAILKQYNIRHIVISPGARNIPFAHSVERDDFFCCYSITDERSAAFFGIGLIQQLKEPVAICCTSGTAVCNYISAVTEAFYQKLPLVVITADRDEYCLNQLEDQDIPQMSYFKEITKASVNVPIIETIRNEQYAKRLVNTALLALNHHGVGPVHINMQVAIGPQEIEFNTDRLPELTVVRRHTIDNTTDLKMMAKQLTDSKKILVIYGQSAPASPAIIKSVEKFFDTFHCVFGVELMSNLQCRGCIDIDNAPHFMDKNFFSDAEPDIIISLKGNYLSDLKGILKSDTWSFKHWLISGEGEIADPYHKLTDIFECTAQTFLEKMVELAPPESYNNLDYYNFWNDFVMHLPVPNDEYSDLYVAKRFMDLLPNHSMLHLANSNSVRLAEIFSVKPNVEVYCNRGTNGIDGSMSSFIGAASVSNKPSYLIIGDLSFFYDMNALANRYVGKNIRILLNNNNCAGIFHFTRPMLQNLDNTIAAGNDNIAKQWVESRGFKYLCASNKKEFDSVIEEFMSPVTEGPIFLEVFSDADKNRDKLREYYGMVNTVSVKSHIKNKVKSILKNI